MSSALAALCLLLQWTGASGFKIGFGYFRGDSLKHEVITERAILNTTVQVCRALAQAEGKDFKFPPQPFTTRSVAVACDAAESSKSFQQSINLISRENWQVDIWHLLNPQYHFDNEEFSGGRELITGGLSAVKASNKQSNFEVAREKLGRLLHTLQDFYSHSNWVEMKNTEPNSNLLRRDTSIGNIADKSRATCRRCSGDDCRDNILKDILQEKVLTSGYFGFWPSKPKGKCSHGGIFDLTNLIQPRGGINKDDLSAAHGHLHREAANMAVAATSELLEDVRGAAGDRTFLQMMGIYKGSSKALVFMIDKTESMRDEIQAVRTLTSSIIDNTAGTEQKPSLYILVPFSDPGFGPVTRTTDPEVFREAVNSLLASGGGDRDEMSLSGLQLALTAAPPNSELFLFTDAPAKDKHLKSAVMALIERTQTVVNFFITDISGNPGRKDNQQHSPMSTSDAQLYRDLAQASGGLAIEVPTHEIPAATSIITESSTLSLVTLLQSSRSPGEDGNFAFTVDQSITNLRVYITGNSVQFTLVSPSGVTQQSTDSTHQGSLITSSQSAGNFQTLQLQTQVGWWEIRMISTTPYTLKVMGESPVDFLFDFLEVSQGPDGGFDVLENRPRAGVNGSLMVTVTGSDSATVTQVILVESSGSEEVHGTVEAQGGEDFLVRFDRIPSEEFVVIVKGQINDSSSVSFQRQSPTTIRASALIVTADYSDGVLVPGTPLSVPFSVNTSGAGGNILITATSNGGFPTPFPSSFFLDSGGSANGTVTLAAPLNATSGDEVTLTIEAQTSDGKDTNYVVLRFTVLATVTDFTRPECELLSLKSSCSGTCSSSTWQLSVQVTDGVDGAGVDSVRISQGSGTINTSLLSGSENMTLVSYMASCCSPDVELLVVDHVGNVGSCFYTNQVTSAAHTMPDLWLGLWLVWFFTLKELVI
ncbi:uncharacterized protein V6R79_026339 [Siganus canaliculatus]